MIRFLIPVVLLVSACTGAPSTISTPARDTPPTSAPAASRLSDAQIRARAESAALRFLEVVETVEPVAEQMCREQTRSVPCDFVIAVDDRLGQPPNAFHTVTRAGEPLIAFNLALLLAVQNDDELAFVMSHEAAHHIAGHIERSQRRAVIAAQVLGGAAATISGGDPDAIRAGQEVGAVIGVRSFSKELELEADALGTVIASRAGYDPIRGAAFFTRLPDPGDVFLGTHPPNAARIETVRRVARGL